MSQCNNAGEGGSDGWEGWFFQWAFTGAAATIVAGSVCERKSIYVSFAVSSVLAPHWIKEVETLGASKQSKYIKTNTQPRGAEPKLKGRAQ